MKRFWKNGNFSCICQNFLCTFAHFLRATQKLWRIFIFPSAFCLIFMNYHKKFVYVRFFLYLCTRFGCIGIRQRLKWSNLTT